jgi:hypothetical protein
MLILPYVKYIYIYIYIPMIELRKRKEKTTETMYVWVKEVWMPQNLKEAVGPHYRD